MADFVKLTSKFVKGLGTLEVGDKPETVQNPYSGESVELEPLAVAVYDLCKGAEILNDYKTMEKCLDYFRRHWPEAYMTLLD